MADATVRPAVPADVDEIARIQVLTWQAGYSGILPAEVLAALDPADAAAQWRQTIEQGPATVFVALEGEWIVGFCSAGASPESESAMANDLPPEDAQTVALIGTLLVEPRWGRRGHGGRLLVAAAKAVRAAGLTRGICWVPEANQSQVSFFTRAGWAPDGVVRTLDAGGRPLRELRMSGSLDLKLA
ncbi:Ribosomal protein S18 acetylase RimI [Actinokineospora alba]|uniref:Ribosomal protein S18 acetylase RimI n=1 Tax=Actinokineospora alba TaxID=504798 RepID=A0A1H0IHL7_9PSEU|nr:GNAT family N-acetyltransferase [Actinokineospora alba]TDP70953.1 ribosomal protein S18 acetylase RimI-like enzyme [Actinokineospora alba]SDI89295.1 Ribosomal protein S18 acetylase RimI [Actinokineospora alba]SDO30541.1 Ribosomal protein S18 acetylase RimI [Actinokineospora alba]